MNKFRKVIVAIAALAVFHLSTKRQFLVNTTSSKPASCSEEEKEMPRLDVYFDREYLPKNETLIEAKGESAWKKDAAKLWKQFDKVQGDCSSPFIRIATPNYGVASSIVHAVNIGWRSFLMGCGVVLGDKNRWKWEEGDTCWPSVMDPLDTACTKHQDVVMAGPNNGITIDRWDQPAAAGHLWSADTTNAKLEYAVSFREKHGDLVFAAAATAYFLQEFLKNTDRQECIAIHIRRGDSCGRVDGYQQEGFRRSCPPFKTYFEEAAKLKERYGWNEVFVATDSPDMDGIRKMAQNYGFVMKSQTMDRSKYNSTELIDERIDKLAKQGAAQEVYNDLSRLVSCKSLVGSLHSTMNQLALQLMVYHHDRIPPFVSVDDPWCPTYSGNNFCPSFSLPCSCVKYRPVQ